MKQLILPDNNILSEITKVDRCENVVQKYRTHLDEMILAITVWHELLYGLYCMPDGKRKKDVEFFIRLLSKPRFLWIFKNFNPNTYKGLFLVWKEIY